MNPKINTNMITVESPTRITLALDIIRKLDNGPLRGYHELGIVKHKIALADTIRLEALDHGDRDIVECDDPRVPLDDSNICVKACEIIRKKYGFKGRFLRIGIDKRIPVMGGMAGGSANAAATLKDLDDIWKLDLTLGDFRELGLALGMDVPFFFSGGTAFDSEATGVLKSIDTDLKFHIILAIPDFGVSTKEAYGGIDYNSIGKNVLSTDKMIKALGDNNLEEAMKYFHNDFEISIFERHPRLKEIRDNLLKAGCLASAMSGSGSTIIGIAADKSQAKKIADIIDCRTVVTESLC
jgi:4-diphosphocytidyl-2-C-methyl-D-erythritol kinase